MKRTIFFLLAAFELEAVDISPYYYWKLSSDYSWGEDREKVFSCGLINNVGCQIAIDDENSLLFLYGLVYQGPGLKEEEEVFSDKSQEHFLFASYKRKVLDAEVKTAVEYIKGFVRSGKLETWETGLYNYERIGCSLGMIKTLRDVDLDGRIALSSVRYPNYTYLLGEIDSTCAEPRYDHNQIKLSFSSFYPFDSKTVIRASYLFRFKLYKNEYIKDIHSGERTSRKQKDGIHTLGFSISTQRGNLSFGADIEAEILRSNYNYVVRKNGIVTAIPSYYDYNLYSLIPYLRYSTERMSLYISLSYKTRSYTERWAEDERGNLLSDKQRDRTTLLLLKVTRPINPALSVALSFVHKDSRSTNKAKVLNCKDNSFGIDFCFEY